MSERETAGQGLTVVIVNFNTRQHITRCLHSIRASIPDLALQIIIVDNASSDGSCEYLEKEWPDVLLLRLSENVGYGRAINIGARHATMPFMMFLNPDIEVTAGSLNDIVAFAKENSPALVGPKLLYSTGAPQPSARRYPLPWWLLLEASRIHLLLPRRQRGTVMLGTYWNQDETRVVPWLSGACHVVSREVWQRVGELTEDTFCAADDLDYCWRTNRIGIPVIYCADVVMIHHCSVAVRKRWSSWQLELVAVNSFLVVIRNNAGELIMRMCAAAECVVIATEYLRNAIRSRRADVGGESYAARLKARLALHYRFAAGALEPQMRCDPVGNPTE